MSLCAPTSETTPTDTGFCLEDTNVFAVFNAAIWRRLWNDSSDSATGLANIDHGGCVCECMCFCMTE